MTKLASLLLSPSIESHKILAMKSDKTSNFLNSDSCKLHTTKKGSRTKARSVIMFDEPTYSYKAFCSTISWFYPHLDQPTRFRQWPESKSQGFGRSHWNAKASIEVMHQIPIAPSTQWHSDLIYPSGLMDSMRREVANFAKVKVMMVRIWLV
jgi:hypothetical protein